MADSRNFQGELLEELSVFLSPLRTLAVDENPVSQALAILGWDLTAFPGFPTQQFSDRLTDLSNALGTLEAAASSPPQSLKDWISATAAGAAVVEDLVALSQLVIQAGIVGGLAQIGEDLLNAFAVSYLRSSHPTIYQLFVLLGIVSKETIDLVTDDNGVTLRNATVLDRLHLEKIPPLLRDPAGALNAEYNTAGGLPDPNGTADKLFPRLVAFLAELGIDAVYGTDPASADVLGADGAALAAHTMVVFEQIPTTETSSAGFGAALTLDSQLGLAVKPFGTLSINEPGANWILTLNAGVSVGGFAISRTEVLFPTGTNNGAITINFAAVKVPEVSPLGDGNGPAVLIGSATGTRLEIAGLKITADATLASTGSKIGFSFVANKGAIHITAGDGDGFLSSVLPGELVIGFDLKGGWSNDRGFFLGGGANLEIELPVDFSIANTVEISAVRLAIVAGSDIQVAASANVSVALGPITAAVEGIGIKETLTFPSEGGNLGPLDMQLGFRIPTGIGIAIDAGSVSGGGFISFDEPNGRYFGALELSVYDISVKAFGLIETKFPDGHKGFSFIIVISAEFTPIELGFGFTLNGVGGLLGINRTIDQDGLLTAIRKGELENVLFPHDVVSQAPAIVHDLQTIFPAADKHYVFGPMAKLAWIELVHGELGIIIEFPGPRLAIIGTVHAALPTPEEALVDLHFDVGGILDFPKKTFSLDASLTKGSRIGDFPVSGDMAMRLSWGSNPNFALSIGGFNKHYVPPAGFPKLQPVTVDLGQHGNPSINLMGYLALTSNTAQMGARLEARISQSGADLYGFVSFDALFVFSPFSFIGELDGAVGVNFHGAGFSLHFHGQVKGPSPWRISGSVCVSILFWDACVGFTLPPLGNASSASLPLLDPWTGSDQLPDGTRKVPGLKPALENQRNWGGSRPPGSFAAVTLTAPADPKAPPPIDPLGSATVRQKACPLELAITKFAGTKASPSRTFHVSLVTIGPPGQPGSTTVTDPDTVADLFAPGQYQAMSDADALSSPSFVSMPAGFTIQSSAITVGTSASVGLVYNTVVFTGTGAPADFPLQYNPSQTNVTTMTKLSAVSLNGLRLSGSFRFFDPTGFRRLTFSNEGYVISLIGTLKGSGTFPLNKPVPRPIASQTLAALLASDATILQKLQVTPYYTALP